MSELSSVAQPNNQNISESLCKDPVRVSISDPITHTSEGKSVSKKLSSKSSNSNDRRARWIHNMRRQPQADLKKMEDEQTFNKSKSNSSGILKRFNSSLRGRKMSIPISDSGFNDHQSCSTDIFPTTASISNRDPESLLCRDSGATSTFDTLESSNYDSPYLSRSHNRSFTKWTPSPTESTTDRKLRLGCSLPFEVDHGGNPQVQIGSSNHRSFEIDNHSHSLSRRNGVRYSLNLRRKSSHSGSTISSESEASQEGCENTLNPSSVLLLPNGVGVNVPGGRKHSVLFSSYDAWNEESIAQSFREMSPSIGNVLEAAWSGESEKLKELLKNVETFEKVKNGQLRDKDARTPLHLAAACGNKDTVQLLLDAGAQVNEYDNQKATPLSCAASCGSLSVLEILLDHGADVNAGYDYGKTALHWAIQAGSGDCAKKLLELGALQNPIKIFSETPLHLAASLGDSDCLQLLLDYGADTALCKGANRSTALHIASEEGNASCIKILLKAGAGHEAKDLRGHTALHIAATCDADAVLALLMGGADPNAPDLNGRTPLHCAVSKGSRAAECVRLLVEKGAEIDAQDNFGYTPLHLAAVNESSQCASILLRFGADVTTKTKAGTTALTLLVRKIPDVMRYLVDRLDSAVTIHDHEAVDPDCEIRLDFRGIVPNVEKKFGGKNNNSKEQTYYHKPRKETEFLTCILAAGNKKILAHPLSEAFLTLKWQRVRKFFWASLLFQIALVALFTIFVVEVYLRKCPYKRHHNYDLHPIEDRNPEAFHGLDPGILPESGGGGINRSILAIEIPAPKVNILIPNATEENTNGAENGSGLRRLTKREAEGFSWFSVKPRPRKNRTRGGRRDDETNTATTTVPPNPNPRGRGLLPDIIPSDQTQTTTDTPHNTRMDEEEKETCEIGLELTVIWGLLVAFAGLMAIKEIFQLLQSPFSYVVSSENWGQWALIGSVGVTAYITPGSQLSYWQYPSAAIGIFLAWGLMLLQVGRFPALGLYVQMLGKVAANFGLFILAYACLLIAFALAFCVLFPEHPPFSSVPLALLKVTTMMVGEVDYEDLFYNEDNVNDPALSMVIAHILHGAFVIIVTIVLMNLLVGLAVHDIQGLQKGAKLNRLSRQTALISRLESFIFSKRLQSCLPRSIGSVLLKSALLVPSSYNWSYYFRPNDPRDQRLPKDLKLAALKLAATKHSSRTIRGIHPDIRLHPSNGSYAGSVKTHNATTVSGVDIQTQAAVRRIEQRLDRLQLQMELMLKAFNDKVETLSVLNEQMERKGGSSIIKRTPSTNEDAT